MEIKFHGDWSNMQKRDINSETGPKPAAAYSQAVEVSGATRMLFISGQVGVEADETTPPGITEQARLAWRNLEAQLKAANMGLDNLVKVTMIVPDPADIPATRPVRAEVLGNRRPASTVIVAGLPNPAWKIEIEGIACA
jgi:2-iminobutanoate/2-iminopropanoate deaminase